MIPTRTSRPETHQHCRTGHPDLPTSLPKSLGHYTPVLSHNHWPALLHQAELTVNLLHAYSDLHSISAYNGIYREPYDFLSHPIAPCGTLIVLHNTRRRIWDKFGLIGCYLGPSLSHYRSYHCLVADSDSYRVSDNIIMYPAPLGLPGASRFDQLLALTERLTLAAENHSAEDQAQLSLSVNSITRPTQLPKTPRPLDLRSPLPPRPRPRPQLRPQPQPQPQPQFKLTPQPQPLPQPTARNVAYHSEPGLSRQTSTATSGSSPRPKKSADSSSRHPAPHSLRGYPLRPPWRCGVLQPCSEAEMERRRHHQIPRQKHRRRQSLLGRALRCVRPYR
jgi:hypothetical protein